MEQKILNRNIESLVKHRNLILVFSLSLLISNILLSAYILTSNKKVILVPGIKDIMEISDNAVSSSYIQATTDMMLSNLLDLNESNIEVKKQTVLKNTTSNSYQSISNYFDKQIADIIKFKISTYFTPREWKINEKKLLVVVTGILSSRFGENGVEKKEINITMKFEYTGGILRLSEFLPIEVVHEQ